MPTLTCNRCGKEDTMMVDAPHLDDNRVYCIECYAILFPPGWTDENPPLTESEIESVMAEDGRLTCPYCKSKNTYFLASIYCLEPDNEFHLVSCDDCAHVFWYPGLPTINAENADNWFDAQYEPK